MKWATTTVIFCVGSLIAVGLTMLYSATSSSSYVVRQMMGLGLGCLLCLSAVAVDYRHLKKVSVLGIIVAVILLGLVWAPGVGVHNKGASRWIDLGPMTFQSSEFAKIALIVALAHYAEWNHRRMPEFRRGFLYPSLVLGLVIGLIFIEPDRGTSILLAGVCGAMLVAAGVRWLWLIPAGLVAGAGLALSLATDAMRMGRIQSWLHLEEHRQAGGYQAYQAMLALGSGGWTGLGLGNGRQKHGWIPEHHTDFIYSIIGEELGLAGTLGVLAAFLALLAAGVYIAWNARDRFGFYLAVGITLLICMQAFINIGVVTSALPNKGLPLPFIGFGGSSVMIMMACVGVLLSVARFSAPAHRRHDSKEMMA